MTNDTRKMMHLTLFLTLSIVLHAFDPGLNVLGAKLGIANIVGIIVLKWYGPKAMITNNLLRVLLVSIMRATLLSIPFYTSLAGVSLSSLVVIILYKLFNPSVLMLSVASSIFHPIGQIIVISRIYSLNQVFILLPLLLILSVTTGVVTGIISTKTLDRLNRNNFK
ncbi:MAG TPA: Gx transporter family protein [Erysipelotrichaceae bacterium]|nr:Gx transporter family protein [Erysipelotrichaceae bacterium]